MAKARIARQLAVSIVVVIGAATCAESKRVANEAPAPPPALVTLVPAPSAGADAAPSASAAATAEPAPPPKPQAPSTTPDEIWCETEVCDLASELCCVLHKSDGGHDTRCVAKPPKGSHANPCCPSGVPGICGADGMTTQRSCDEAADCSAGQRCCDLGAGEGDIGLQLCMDECWDELCLPGSTCLNSNLCGPVEGLLAGRCPMQIKPPECAGVTCNEGQACCWDAKQSRGQCADECKGQDDVAYRCTSPEQCTPFDCNRFWEPQFDCGGGGFTNAVLCDTLKDCPEHLGSLGSGPGSPRAVACVHTAELPPGVKACDYQ